MTERAQRLLDSLSPAPVSGGFVRDPLPIIEEALAEAGEGGTVANPKAEAALNLLRKLEWEHDQCPECLFRKEEGHAGNCKLAEILAP